jgi:transporter family-2 protein
MKYLLIVLIAIAGAGIPVQVAANKQLEEGARSPALATGIAFAIGSIAMLLLSASGVLGRGSLGGLQTTPWWGWLGGILSAAVVILCVIALPRAGEEAVVGATILGQLVAAALIDHFGWLGVKRVPLNAWRIGGAVAVFAGVLLMQRK